MFIYAIVLIAFFGISAAARAFPISIFILSTKETITLEVNADDYIEEIKVIIQAQTGIRWMSQRLFFSDKELRDGLTLSAYHIGEHNPPHMLGLTTGPSPYSPDPETAGLQFFRLCDECMLPATGFSSLHPAALSAQPYDLRYTDVGMRLMIPSLDVDSELVSVPLNGDSWAVEWLDDRAGVLEGSALPGEGFSIVAAHNTLNDTEYGPFALLGTLELNELIAVSGMADGLRIFRIFANELLAPDDMEKMASIAGSEENTLVLITCENESADGGYLNRRAVFAKPVF